MKDITLRKKNVGIMQVVVSQEKKARKVPCHQQDRLENDAGDRTVSQEVGHQGFSKGTKTERGKASIPEDA